MSPGIFTASATGSGAAAAQAVRVSPSGAQTIENLLNAAGAVPVDFGADGDRVVLVLYGTGIQRAQRTRGRHRQDRRYRPAGAIRDPSRISPASIRSMWSCRARWQAGA